MADDLTPPELVEELRLAIYSDQGLMRVVILRGKQAILSAEAHSLEAAMLAAAKGAAVELRRDGYARHG